MAPTTTTTAIRVGDTWVERRDVAGITRGAGRDGLVLTVHTFPIKKVRALTAAAAVQPRCAFRSRATAPVPRPPPSHARELTPSAMAASGLSYRDLATVGRRESARRVA